MAGQWKEWELYQLLAKLMVESHKHQQKSSPFSQGTNWCFFDCFSCSLLFIPPQAASLCFCWPFVLLPASNVSATKPERQWLETCTRSASRNSGQGLLKEWLLPTAGIMKFPIVWGWGVCLTPFISPLLYSALFGSACHTLTPVVGNILAEVSWSSWCALVSHRGTWIDIYRMIRPVVWLNCTLYSTNCLSAVPGTLCGRAS